MTDENATDRREPSRHRAVLEQLDALRLTEPKCSRCRLRPATVLVGPRRTALCASCGDDLRQLPPLARRRALLNAIR